MNRRLLSLCGALFLLLLLPLMALRADEKGASDAEAKFVAKDVGAKNHGSGHKAAGAAGAAAHPSLGENLSVLTVLPFVALLGFIAICPLFFAHWWEKNQNKGIIVGLLAVPLALYLIFLVDLNWSHDLLEKIKEYISFMILLGALYIISGGIYVKGSLSGTPLANTCILALGAVIASIIGTTGASVLLIRPLLRANKTRQNKAHIVVLFIFIVSNCGGLLTPLGDPPLFLGFLKGVPFEWTFQLWPQWLTVNLALLFIFNIWDQFALDKEEKERAGSQLEEVMKHEPIGLQGALNFLFLAGIVATIYLTGRLTKGDPKYWGLSEAVMAIIAMAAYFSTARQTRENNKFTFAPIIEVAVLFIGIFVTMAPALQILNSWGKQERDVLGVAFGMTEPWHFFWASGALSSFLDNAPTYLTFAATASGMKGIAVGDGPYLAELKDAAPRLLAAISCGSVFMGANTYIGNGPNFMVKAIAEENGVKMPSFGGYTAYSGCILIPIFIVVTLLFFRG
jgi:Na+/H+ antiporter NhaD/arsenite permease-like protein